MGITLDLNAESICQSWCGCGSGAFKGVFEVRSPPPPPHHSLSGKTLAWSWPLPRSPTRPAASVAPSSAHGDPLPRTCSLRGPPSLLTRPQMSSLISLLSFPRSWFSLCKHHSLSWSVFTFTASKPSVLLRNDFSRRLSRTVCFAKTLCRPSHAVCPAGGAGCQWGYDSPGCLSGYRSSFIGTFPTDLKWCVYC